MRSYKNAAFDILFEHEASQGQIFAECGVPNLIKQVVEEISKRHAQAKTYVTLSPVPGFHRWLSKTASEHGVDAAEIQAMAKSQGENAPIASRDVALRLCAHYLINERLTTT